MVEFWRAVEMFSPPSIRDEPSWQAKVFRLKDGEPPPWDPAHPLARLRPSAGMVWQHTVYGGIFGLERLRDVVVGVFGEDEQYRDTRLSGSSAVFALSLNSSGKLIEDSEVVSACAWAVGRTLRRGPKRRDWLDSAAWANVRKDFATRVTQLGTPGVPDLPGLPELSREALAERVRKAAAQAAGAGVGAAVTPTASALAGPVLGAAAGKAASTFAQQLIDASKETPDDSEAEGEEDVVDKRRPVTIEELRELLEETAESLGVTDALGTVEIWVRSTQVSAKAEENADNDFLNSFILDDLERAQTALASGAGVSALQAYLRPIGAIDTAARVDLRQAPATLLPVTAPQVTPPGRWVTKSEHGLALSQQFAVNQILQATTGQRVPVYAVNGPPGTGKTTMLRDVIAALLVERARRLAALATPEAAFSELRLAWSTEAWRRHVRPLRPELTGFELVVACAGNGAAKNITHEFPGPKGIDEDWWDAAREVDYFADAASIALEIEEAEPEARAWAAVAGALGNMDLRKTFTQRLWWGVTAREEAAAKREKRQAKNSGHGVGDILSQYRKSGEVVDWKAAVARFTTAKNAVDRLTAERQAAFDAGEAVQAEEGRIAKLAGELDATRTALRRAEADVSARTAQRDAARAAADRAEAARREHAGYRPGVWVSLSTRGKAGRDWYDLDQQLALKAATSAGVLVYAEQDVLDAAGRLQALRVEYSRVEMRLADAEERLARAKAVWTSAFGKWPQNVPSTDVFDDERRRELLAPWNDPEIAAARTRLFLEALRLHKQFLLATAGTMRQNLQAAFDLVNGDAPLDIAHATAKAAWQSLFLLVPVLSTTFASMGRLFSHLGSADLGWVLIDEAGQATPQNAVGALWRAKRAVIVGDPLQLEPVFNVPHTLQQALRVHFGVAEEWLPGWTSVQAVADRLAPHGTYLEVPSPDGTRDQTWVGAPLRVHRRCDDPMFTLSNQIAYAGLMVNGKHRIPPEKDPYLAVQSSRWVDVRSAETEGTWIPAEGEKLRQILEYLLGKHGLDPTEIRVISPFRDVVKGVKDLGLGLPGDDPVGTIHTMQGKEADIVFLVLGGGKKGQRDWAAKKPNLLNVAVSRAKRRLYVIGNRERWKEEHYFDELAAELPESPKALS